MTKNNTLTQNTSATVSSAATPDIAGTAQLLKVANHLLNNKLTEEQQHRKDRKEALKGMPASQIMKTQNEKFANRKLLAGTPSPTYQPTAVTTSYPTFEPTFATTQSPSTPSPTKAITNKPTTPAPTVAITSKPTTAAPTAATTSYPTFEPTPPTTHSPTKAITAQPTTPAPTVAITSKPTTAAPTAATTSYPTFEPTFATTQSPSTFSPTKAITAQPTTPAPTVAITSKPTTAAPTAATTNYPTFEPTFATQSPSTTSPTQVITAQPTIAIPTKSPTQSLYPTQSPTQNPTAKTQSPTLQNNGTKSAFEECKDIAGELDQELGINSTAPESITKITEGAFKKVADYEADFTTFAIGRDGSPTSRELSAKWIARSVNDGRDPSAEQIGNITQTLNKVHNSQPITRQAFKSFVKECWEGNSTLSNNTDAPTTDNSLAPTPETKTDTIPDWVIPTGAAGGGVLLTVIAALCYKRHQAQKAAAGHANNAVELGGASQNTDGISVTTVAGVTSSAYASPNTSPSRGDGQLVAGQLSPQSQESAVSH